MSPSRPKRRRRVVRRAARTARVRGPAGAQVIEALRSKRQRPGSHGAGQEAPHAVTSLLPAGGVAPRNAGAAQRLPSYVGLALGAVLCVSLVVAAGVSLLAHELPSLAAVEPPGASTPSEADAPRLDAHDRAHDHAAHEHRRMAAAHKTSRKALQAWISSGESLPSPEEIRAAGWPVRDGVSLGEHAQLLLLRADASEARAWVVTATPQLRVRTVPLPPCVGTDVALNLEPAPPKREPEQARLLLREYSARATVLPSALDLAPGPRVIEAWHVTVDEVSAEIRVTLRALTHAVPTTAAEWIAWIETCCALGEESRAARALSTAHAQSEQAAQRRERARSFFGAVSPAAFEYALERLARDLEPSLRARNTNGE